MIRIPSLVAGVLTALILLTGSLQDRASAQGPRHVQKWEYATLNYMENDAGSFAAWITPKERFTAKSKTKHHESLTKINKDLGGKDDVGIFDVCVLLTRIGKDGWELVTHTKTADRGTQTFTWTFKRPSAMAEAKAK